MKPSKRPTDVSKELANLKHNTKQNKALPKLPENTFITKRPINHAPVASVYAGAKVPKIVYVSRKTPLMSAVKRVKKFLQEVEKRALQSENVSSVLEKNGGRSSRDQGNELQRKLEDVSDKLRRDAEEVLVKASGRAMEQALRIAEWFRNRESEVLTNVEVRTGSVSVVDDIVEKEKGDDVLEAEVDAQDKEDPDRSGSLVEGDTTKELLGRLDAAMHTPEEADAAEASESMQDASADTTRRGRRKRKRKEYDADDVPEARLRWIKTIEIAISLRA